MTDREVSPKRTIDSAPVHGRSCAHTVCEGGDSTAALNEQTATGAEDASWTADRKHISIAITCSDAPEGHADWTMQLLADKVVAMGFAESISLETMRQILKKTNSSHGRRRSGAYRK